MSEFIIPEDGHFIIRMRPKKDGPKQDFMAFIVNGNEEMPFGQVTAFTMDIFNTMGAGIALSELRYTIQAPNGRAFSGAGSPASPDDQHAAMQVCVRESGFLVENLMLTAVTQ